MRCFIERRGQGRPVVFVRGWGFTGSIWDEFIGELTQEYEVFVADLPGCGLARGVRNITRSPIWRPTSSTAFLPARAESVGLSGAWWRSPLVEGLELLASADLRSALSRMEAPVLAILGDRDLLIPGGVADPLMRLSPRLCTHAIAGAGHVPFISHQHETRRMLREFFDGDNLARRLSAR